MKKMLLTVFMVHLMVGHVSLTNATPVTWGTAFELTSDSQIDVSGGTVRAYNGGTGDVTATLSGKSVTFLGVDNGGSSFDRIVSDPADIAYGQTNAASTVPWASSDLDLYTPSTGNADLDTVLDSQIVADGSGVGVDALTILLENLSVGQLYRVQIVGAAHDDKFRADYVDGLEGDTAVGLGRWRDLDSDAVYHVPSIIGTFTANSTTEDINIVVDVTGKSPGFSALLLTAVPEPTSASIALAACAMLVPLRRTRR